MLAKNRGNKIYQFNDSFGCKKIKDELDKANANNKQKLIYNDNEIDYALPMIDYDDEYEIIDMIVARKLNPPIYDAVNDTHAAFELKMDQMYRVLENLESDLLEDLYDYTLKVEMKIAYEDMTKHINHHIDDRNLINCVIARINNRVKLTYIYNQQLKDHIIDKYVSNYAYGLEA